MRLPPTSRFLPALVLVALVLFGVRGVDFWRTWRFGTPPAQAETAATPSPPPSPLLPPQQPPAPVVEQPVEPALPPPLTAPPATEKPPESPPDSASNADADAQLPREFSAGEIEVLQNLAKRRAEIEQRATALDQKEALLTAAAQQVDEKVKELQALKTELHTLLNTVDTQQKERVVSLVKIYETMKPREAAAIIETLDMTVALSVLESMREAKSAPILAAMTPEKASAITVAMSQRRKLPDVPQ